MTFISDETSAYGSRPIELYRFEADGTFYYRTPHQVPYTFLGSEYLPSPQLDRQNIVRAAAGDKPPEMVVNIEEADPLVQAICYDIIPVTFKVRIYRVQPTGQHTWWDGDVDGVAHKGDRTELRCPSILDHTLRNEIPGVHFTAQCNHFLFDAHCRLDPLDFAQAATITSVDGVAMVVSTVGGHPADYFKGGVVLSESGERRMIVSQTGTTLALFYGFHNVAATENVTLYPGCDRMVTTCVDKYDNILNFGGFPVIPIRNRFRN
jgi:uncharacterized phage protein (TIGR02218 family)